MKKRASHTLLQAAGVAGSIVLMITSCSVGPNYVRPSAAVPASYKELADWKIAEPKDHLPRGKWWELFRDPVLDALEGQVNIANLTVAQAEAQFRQARAEVQVARSGYFPAITANASVLRSGGPSGGSAASGATGTAGGASSGGNSTDYSVNLDARWELDLWGRVRRQVEAGVASAQASGADLENIRLSMQSAVAQDYFQLRVLDEQLRILNETVAAYQKSLELTQNRYASGVASRADILQAETQLHSTRVQAIDLGVQRSQLEHAIAVLLGKPPSDFAISPLAGIPVPPVVPVGMPSDLLERRPDIAAAERRIAAANAQIGVAEAAYFPALTLNATGGFEQSVLSKLLSWSSSFWSIGPSLSGTLFNGGLRQAQVEQARAAYDANVASYRETVLAAFQDVEDNLAALRILDEEALAQDQAVKAARQSVDVTMNQYKVGVASYLNVIVTQTAALSNERNAVDILGRRLNATILLMKAMGGGWQGPSGKAGKQEEGGSQTISSPTSSR